MKGKRGSDIGQIACWHLRGAAGSCGSLALDGCVSFSGALVALVHTLRALQWPDAGCRAASRLCARRDVLALAFNRDEMAARWP